MASVKGRVPKFGYWRVFYALLFSNLITILFYVLRAVESGSDRYWFLIWNLLLAWMPLLFAWVLVDRIPRKSWVDPINILLTVLWLGFLPNSFYVVSDLIHLQVTGEVSLLYDAVMFSSFIFNAYLAGYMSLFLIHRELVRRLSYIQAHSIIGGVILACSFAIYLGRNLRWNTWDVLVNPAGLLFDVSDRFINPSAHPQAIVTTVTFFVLIGSIYAVTWQLVTALRADNR